MAVQEPDPLVSVVIPVYNRADMLIEAAWSVFRQAYRPLELVIVDDASTDGIDNALIQLEAESIAAGVELKVIRNAQNRGCGFSLHRGFMAAKGRYVAYLGSDDRYLHPLKTKEQVRKMEETDADWSYVADSWAGSSLGSAKRIRSAYLPRMAFLNRLFEWSPRLRTYILFWRNPINSSSIMVSWGIYRAYGGWRAWTKNADCDGALVIYYSFRRLRCAVLKGRPVFYRTHEGQVIRSEAYQQAFKETRERIFRFLADEGMSKRQIRLGRFFTWLRSH